MKILLFLYQIVIIIIFIIVQLDYTMKQNLNFIETLKAIIKIKKEHTKKHFTFLNSYYN